MCSTVGAIRTRPYVLPSSWHELDLATGRERALFDASGDARLVRHRAESGSAAASLSDDDAFVVFDGESARTIELADRGPGISLSEDGTTVTVGTDDDTLVYALDGTELRRGVRPNSLVPFVDPSQRTAWFSHRPPPGEEPTTQIIRVDLETDRATRVDLPERGFIRSMYFDEARERVVLSFVNDRASFILPPHSLYAIGPDQVPRALESDLAILAYDRCEGRLIAAGDDGEVLALDPMSGARTELAPAISFEPTRRYPPFSALSALSPDGRHVVWLGDSPDRRGLIVTDLLAGTSTFLEVPELPVPWGCCETVGMDARFGDFREGFLSLGVSAQRLLPICSCAPPEEAAPVAYRVRLDPPAIESFPHCGRTTPWMLEDGQMLVCDEREGSGVRLAITVDDGLAPVSDGPVDVHALPLDRSGSRGCSAPLEAVWN